ncbi:MAG: methyltransferase domain-containing protein [Trichocoleus desertorum ATA4-8-CV12]|nr:methyltransferase domain-containing protein [Trichocoleus desertorum ATA4-8-CV12]
MVSVKEVEYWEQRYHEGTDRWDLGQAAPAFVTLLSSPSAPKPGRVAVLGCGRGYDALLFAAHGFDVVGFDFAPAAIAAATALAQASQSPAQFLQRDIFDLAAEFPGEFDYVIEHTCFCAIAPEQRPTYVQLVHTLLKPQGQLLALFFTHHRPGGPPFGITPTEIRQYFEPRFDLLGLKPVTNSVPERQGEEHLGYFQPQA